MKLTIMLVFTIVAGFLTGQAQPHDSLKLKIESIPLDSAISGAPSYRLDNLPEPTLFILNETGVIHYKFF